MEKTPHILLVGEGARLFAVQQGFPLETVNTAEGMALWEKRRQKSKDQIQPHAEHWTDDHSFRPSFAEAGKPADSSAFSGEPPHDTVAVLALDQNGNLGGVCTTSGLPFKMPGRVGDSPLIGHGLYVDNTAGAAGGTGRGEEVIRIGGSMMIVEAMRAGRSPQEACEAAVRKVNAVAVRRGVHPADVAFIALDPKGRVGAACTEKTNFFYAVARQEKVELLKAPELGPEK
jgi:isoaspartyl peptidase/L-asparaginase-like protein (Ntn-hydrolase superfamily)